MEKHPTVRLAKPQNVTDFLTAAALYISQSDYFTLVGRQI
jgi:hypothetical protein